MTNPTTGRLDWAAVPGLTGRYLTLDGEVVESGLPEELSEIAVEYDLIGVRCAVVQIPGGRYAIRWD